MKNNSFKKYSDILITPGPRIANIAHWLQNDVWNEERYLSNDNRLYLEGGEKQVRDFEELALSTAPGIYDELVSLARQNNKYLYENISSVKTALVILDGASLRELPILTKLASDTGFNILEKSFGYSALPSDTESFVEQKLLGKKISPAQLTARKEFASNKIKAYYYDTPIRYIDLPQSDSSIILWSAFPDGTYMNFEARNSSHFETLVKQFDVVWKNIIQSIPKGYRIIITSDHGYIYLNGGFESSEKAESALQFLEQNRSIFTGKIDEAQNIQELKVLPDLNLAMIKGRIKNRPKGQSANKVFRHGGLSLMEVLTPWLVIEKLS